MYPYESYKKLSWVTFAEWPAYKGETTIEAVAESVIEQYDINNKTIVGGSSLGGMVSIQIAKILGIKKVILIGSATKPSYVNPVLQTMSSLSDFAPIKFFQLLAGKVNFNGSNELLLMFERADENFIRSMCKAIFEWTGIGDYNCEICQIHGAKDMVIFPPEENARIIEDGGHLISITHSDLVSEYINIKTKTV